MTRTAAPAVPVLPLELEPATRELLPRLAELSAAAFGDAAADSREKVERFFTAPAVSGYAARLDGRVAGAPVLQHRGRGGLPLRLLCGARPPGAGDRPVDPGAGPGARPGGRPSCPSRLEVDAVNDRALGLYTACGFRETARCDYWRMAL